MDGGIPDIETDGEAMLKDDLFNYLKWISQCLDAEGLRIDARLDDRID